MADLSPQEWFDTINAMFTSVTRRPWEDRLARPVSGLDCGSFFTRYTTPRNRMLDMLWSYKTGDAPLPKIEPEYEEAFRHVMRKSRCNYAGMVVASMLDRMELQAVSTLDDDDTDGDDIAAAIMDESGVAAMLKDVFSFAFAMSESYGMAVPGVEGGPTLPNGRPVPSLHAIDPRRCIGIPDLDNPTRLRAAVVRAFDPIGSVTTAYLFLPGRKYQFTQAPGQFAWNMAGEPESVDGLDSLGGIPIVRFDNLDGQGEYEPHIDLLDRINDVTLQRIIGFWYQALRQRGIKTDEDEKDEDDGSGTDELDGNNQADLNAQFKAGPGALWKFPKDWEIWESQQTDFGPLLNGKRDDVKELAAVTSTPLHLITPDAADGSAEGAGLMREGLTSKVRDRRTRFTPSLRMLWRIAFAMAGEPDRGRKLRLHWGPVEFRTLAEMGSASAQAAGTLSTEDRGERIWQMSPEENARNMRRLTAERLIADVPQNTPQQNPSPTGGAAVTNDQT